MKNHRSAQQAFTHDLCPAHLAGKLADAPFGPVNRPVFSVDRIPHAWPRSLPRGDRSWAKVRAALLGSMVALGGATLGWAQDPGMVGATVQPVNGDKSPQACAPDPSDAKTASTAKSKPAKCAPTTQRSAAGRSASNATGTAGTAPIPPRQASNNESIRSYTYQAGRVYSVPTGLGIATQIVLDPSEKIRDFGTGFSSGWDIVRRDHVIYLKPKDPDAETNMYIRTDQRSYLLDLKIVSKDWIKIDEARAQGVAYVVQFTYPDVAARNQQLPGAGDAAADPAAPQRSPYLSFHTDYEAASEAGAKWLTPLRVYDDGVVTYVQMPQMAQVPAFFGRLSDRGEEFLLNRSMDKGRHVLHGVYPFLVIRHGSDVVAVRRR